ncbi:MAG: hypothetical protein ACOYOA_06770 [Saprospiraceae bacterium]
MIGAKQPVLQIWCLTAIEKSHNKEEKFAQIRSFRKIRGNKNRIPGINKLKKKNSRKFVRFEKFVATKKEYQALTN